MTSDGDALFRAICERPREDTPRLMYANWLDEHGQPERAAFIRFQCEFPEWSSSHPRFQELLAREREFEPHFPTWLKSLPRAKGIEWWEVFWGRGFTDSITFSSTKAFADHADAVFAAAPLRLVQVRRVTDRTIGRVLQSKYVKRIHNLNLSGSYSTAGVRQIAACADLADLDSLCVWGTCTDECATVLAASPHLGRLTRLSFCTHTLTDRGVTALIESDPLRAVVHLVLHGTRRLGPGTIRRLHERYKSLH